MAVDPVIVRGTADERRTRRIRHLASCSRIALDSILLERLDKAAKLRRELKEIIEEWVEAEVEARLAVEARELRSVTLMPLTTV